MLFRTPPILMALIVLLLTAASCDNYNKVLKSNDVDLKLERAKHYYNKGDYYRAIPLMDELIIIYRGREELEEIYLMYCYAHYGQGNYLVSAYNFKNYATFYPKNPKAEEALFMTAKSYFMLTPPPELDQTNALKALDALQYFLSVYPNSSFKAEANSMADKLMLKMEIKDFSAAKLYFDMQQYRAAAVSFKNLLKSYPDSPRAEEIHFLIVKSYYLFARNSIQAKQHERYEETIEAYKALENRYPQSEYLKEATSYYRVAQQSISNTQNPQ